MSRLPSRSCPSSPFSSATSDDPDRQTDRQTGVCEPPFLINPAGTSRLLACRLHYSTVLYSVCASCARCPLPGPHAIHLRLSSGARGTVDCRQSMQAVGAALGPPLAYKLDA